MKLTGIHVYPVKSLAGFSTDSWEAAAEGLLYDRKWMLVDQMGKFCTQRNFPQMSKLQARIEGGKLYIEDLARAKEVLVPEFSRGNFSKETVRVWKDDTLAIMAPADINLWLSEALGFPVSLYKQTSSARRKHSITGNEKTVSFADSQPFLIIGTASLRDLNDRLGETISMNRFRPNLVVETAMPYIEDTWKTVQVGNCMLKKTKPCGRCKMVNVNPETGVFDKQILEFLGTYRTEKNSINFGIRTTWLDYQPGQIMQVNQAIKAQI